MKNYCPVTLDQYINESKSITLKRGYGERKPVVVGTNAPSRNRILSFVQENLKVPYIELKKFIAGLNETNINPNAAASMWLKRNSQYFITENKNGRTYYKLSSIGERLVRNINPNKVSESVKTKKFRKLNENLECDYDLLYDKFDKFMPDDIDIMENFYDILDAQNLSHDDRKQQLIDFINNYADFDYMNNLCPDGEVEEFADYILNFEGVLTENKKYKRSRPVFEEDKKFDFKDPKTGKPGLVDSEEDEDLDESEKTDEDESCETNEGLTIDRKNRIERLIENIKTKERKLKLFEEEEEDKDKEDEDKEEDGADELSFDDLDLETDDKEEGEDKKEDKDDSEKTASDEDDKEDEDKVEITEFIITVDDVESAIKELSEKDVEASKVVDPDGEPEEDEEHAYKKDEISVPADYWETLKEWLEEKGVDVEEMFGGEISVEDEKGVETKGDDEEESEESDEDINFDNLDLDDEEGEEIENDELEESDLEMNEDGDNDENAEDEESEESEETDELQDIDVDDNTDLEDLDNVEDTADHNNLETDNTDSEDFNFDDDEFSIQPEDIDFDGSDTGEVGNMDEEEPKSELLTGAKEVIIKY